jgi:hypothetical protein
MVVPDKEAEHETARVINLVGTVAYWPRAHSSLPPANDALEH